MKSASCPVHGRDYLANAGAPNVVRCTSPAGCTIGILEPCRHCHGEPVHTNERGTTTYCSACTSTPTPGWRPRRSQWGSPYPVS